jgi:sugar phosphate isomerase/epimerase
MLRIAVAIAPEDALASAFVVWRGIDSSLAKAADYGYDGVELALKTADQVDAGVIQRKLAAHKLACPCISTGQVFAGLGLYLTASDKAKRTEALTVFKGLIDLAGQLGAMVNMGRARGLVEQGEQPEAATGRFVDAARELADYASSRSVTIVLEPVNRYEINFVNSVTDAADLLDCVAKPNVKIMPDLFHMNIEDQTIDGELERFASRVAYIHVADSNRLAPGQGHTDFRAFFASLRRMRYDGWLTAEILPKPDPDTAARQAIDFLRPLVDQHNHADQRGNA